MQVAALCYCNEHLTDGFVPRAVARTLLDWQMVSGDGRVYQVAHTCGHVGDDVDCAWIVPFLLDAGMWEEVVGGYQIHDYSDYQPTRDDVEALREKKKAAGQASAAARSQRAVEQTVEHAVEHAVDRVSNKTATDGQPDPVTEPESVTDPKPESEPKPKSKPSRARRAEHEHPAFKRFWEIYPRRLQRADAARAFTAVVERECVDPQLLVTAAGNYAELVRRRGDEPKFVKHADTFLRNQRWADYAHGIPEDELRAGTNRLSASQRNVENVMRMVRGGEHGPRGIGAGDRPAERVLPAHDAP